MAGLEFDDKYQVKEIVKALLDKGLVASMAGQNTLRLLPPLIVNQKEIDQMGEILETVLKELNQ